MAARRTDDLNPTSAAPQPPLPIPGSAGPGSYAPPPGYIWDPGKGQYVPKPGTLPPGVTFDPTTGIQSGYAPNNTTPVGPTAATPPPTTTTPPPATKGPAAPPPPGSIGAIALSPSPIYPTPTALPTVPTFTPPNYTPPPAFKGPSVGDLLQDPSYQWRKDQGEQSLQRWAAAKGTLNDSGTAKALTDYGQGAASQEYQNVWNRDYGAYQTNYQTQYQDPNNIAFRDAAAKFAPQMAGYQTDSASIQRNNELQQQYAYNTWVQDWQKYFSQEQLQAGTLK